MAAFAVRLGLVAGEAAMAWARRRRWRSSREVANGRTVEGAAIEGGADAGAEARSGGRCGGRRRCGRECGSPWLGHRGCDCCCMRHRSSCDRARSPLSQHSLPGRLWTAQRGTALREQSAPVDCARVLSLLSLSCVPSARLRLSGVFLSADECAQRDCVRRRVDWGTRPSPLIYLSPRAAARPRSATAPATRT